jgi:hypothetical protein
MIKPSRIASLTSLNKIAVQKLTLFQWEDVGTSEDCIP